jgi:catechol 2,3-dioxygenase-like lactoylglutathione lyase family enzyme
MIQGLSHITLICHDLDKTKALLEAMDAKMVYDSGAQTFSLSEERFYLLAGIWIATMKGPSVSKTYNHIAFAVEAAALPEYERRIRALGLEVLPGRSRHPLEGESLYFYDADNHLFELHTGSLRTRLAYYQQCHPRGGGDPSLQP